MHRQRRALLPVHAFVFFGALLLFSLEPMVGRLLLPRFGGAFHVWTTALMFFQGALLLAYLYAHLVAGRIGRWHLAVVALPVLWLPPDVGQGAVSEAGSGAILTLLLVHVAVPFAALATTAIVAQRWLAQSGREPYRLYAVSNAGSLGALILYALLVEPLVGLRTQRWAWAAGYLAYLGLAIWAWRAKGPDRAPGPLAKTAPSPAPRPRALLYWASLSAAPSAFSMAVTNLLALEAGNVPLVWVIPLAIYLGSFVVAFASPPTKAAGDASAPAETRAEPREPRAEPSRVPNAVRRLWPHVAAVGVFFYSGGEAGGWIDVAVQLIVLAFVTLAAHAELYRARPAADHLTLYYLVIALGGWAGGAFVALLAPAAFSGLWEYPLSLVGLAVTVMVGRHQALWQWLRTAPRLALVVSAALVLVIAFKIASAASEPDAGRALAVRRSFYGLYHVTETTSGRGAVRDLVSGGTRHGRQRVGDLTPLSYYHPRGPLGDALSVIERPARLGVVGLGVGAAAGHLRAGERARFFEIDQAVAELAREHFTYLSESPGDVEVVVGDARLSLQAEAESGAPRYDLLLIDAFAGDAIPTHLLTVEALRLYLSRLEPGALLLLHVSNRYYDLVPVLGAAAAHLGLPAASVSRYEDLAPDQDPSRYVALSRRAEVIRELLRAHGWDRPSGGEGRRPWTDDHVDVLEALATR